MEDNQVITNGDPLKDLYTEFNPKLNLAKSYDDFKATMQDSNNRKAFFDEFNSKLNLANDYNQFENVLGLKKKAGGAESAPIPSKLPSQGSNLPDFEKNQNIAERGFIMPEATPEQQPKGSYLNVGQNLRQKAVEKAAEIDAASLEFLRNLSGKIPIIGKKPEKIYENGELTEYGKNIPYSDFLGKAIKGINDVKFKEQELQQTTGKLPETIGGEVVGGITSLAPDLALAAMTGGKNLFSGTGNLAAIGNAVTGAFVREQAIAGAAKGYGEAENKGAGADETLATTLKESGKSAGVGALYELAGLGGSRLGNVLSKGLENVTAKEAVNLGARLATFSLGVPTVESAISEGKLPEYKDILKNLGIAGAMEAFHLAPAIVKKINNLRTGSAVNNFMNAPADVIDDLVQSKQDAQNLNLTAMDAVKRAEGMEDGAEKSQLLKTASNLTQAADIKHVTDVIANSSDGLAHIANDLPEDVRDAFMKKAQDIHQTLNPAELQKQGHAANISQAEEIVKQFEPLAKPENPNVLERIQAERKLNEAKGVIDENTKNLNKVLDEQEKRNQQIQEAKLKEEVKPTEVSPEADIEKRRQEELNKEENQERLSPIIFEEDIKTKEDRERKLQIEKEQKQIQENRDKVNAKYDAELKALEEVKPIEEQLKTKENAIQEPSTGEVLQRPQEGIGKTGGERPRVEPSIQGTEIAKEGKQAKINEEEELTPYQKALKEKQEAEKKQTKQFAGEKAGATRKIIDESNKIEANDARSATLKYLTGAKLSWDAIDEISGNVKRATLNTGARELKSREARARDYVAKKGEGQSLDEAAHSIWENLSEEMQGKMDTQDIKDALMNAVSEHTSKAEAAKALIEGYKEESIEELERKHYEKYGDNAEKEADSQFNDAPQEDLDIDKELINANYETEQQFQDAYWDAHQATYNAPEKAPSIEAEKPAITEEEKPVEKVNEFLHTGTEEERQKGLLKNLMSSGIPEDYKKGLEENGLTYKVSNQAEASDAAKAIIQSLGVTDALDIARGEKIDPSVGSAIYAESLNNLWSNERRLKADGKIEEANALGKQWSDITMEYANKLNSKGKWTAQTAYFYKTSPMGFAIRIENERVEQFQTWYENKEKDYKKVFTEILKSEEGQALLKEEVEKISKEERAKTRADKRQKIDEFFENAKLKGNNLYAIPIPTQVINGALEVMKKAVLAGESVTNAVSMAVEHISKEVKDWDKDKFRKEYEEKLNKVTNDRDNEKLLLKKIAELKRRLEEKDFSAEEYKTKRTLSEKEQAAKDEYDKVKKLYDEAKKESPEYIDKKAKQYLDKLRQRLRGIDESKKEEIIRRSIKEIVKSGGLEYEDFKDIVSETIGIKKLTDEQKSQIESLTEQSNIADDLEQKFLDNPTRESIDAFRKAKANSLEADRKLFEMTSQKADIVGTLKSLITLNYLGASTLIKNYAQNVIYQATVRFPTSLAKRGIDQSVYGATYMGNKMFGTKVIKPSISLTDAQKGYFNEYRDGVIRGWDQMIKGVDEKDYFATNQYASSLNPRKSFNDLKAAMKGELFLSKGQKIDKFIQATLGWQPYAISRGMIYGDKPPRYAAQGAEALQIARKELGITDPFETEAFMLSPEKYAYNHLIKKSGLSTVDAAIESKSISKRIVDAGAVATFQNENMLNNLISKIDEWATVKKDDQWTAKVVKPPVALLKATTIPFLKTPANIYWAYFKLANPALTMTKSLVEAGLAQHALKKGDLIGYREFNKKSKESFGTAMIGLAITTVAATFAAKGLIRTSVQEEDKAREKAGEGFFGKSNELNLGALTGGDDFWVDLSWFGPIGTIIDVRGRMMEDNKQKELRGEKVDNGVMNEIVSTMGYSVSSTLNTLIFDQGAKMVDAIRKGWSGGLNQVAVNNANALGNVVLGATIPAINKALAPEKADLAADNVLDQIANNQKQRNVFVTWAKGYPPSKVSIWGEPISQDRTVSGVLGAMLGFEKGSADKFGAILYNEQRRTGKNEFFPPVEDKKIKVNGNDVKITVEEKRDLDTYIGQARKTLVSPFINDKSIYTVFLRKSATSSPTSSPFTYSELTAGKNKAGQTISQEEADRVKLAALDIIYENGKKAGFSKFKEKYIQYQDATLNVEKLQKQALESAEKTIFKAKIEQPPQ